MKDQQVLQKNVLGLEQSPYLLQHANNPIWWQVWGPAVFQTAKVLDRPVFVSIGYSTCHWCHVMEHESFKDPEVARCLNENFLAIKVDREERPDVDAQFMEVALAMNGQGGWPLTVIMTPAGVPFFSGTYFSRPQLLSILARIAAAWSASKTEILESGMQIREFLNHTYPTRKKTDFDYSLLKVAREKWEALHDEEYGGKKGSPKFPHAYEDRFTLYYDLKEGKNFFPQQEKTAQLMSRGGIYDHLGGGFHRYSVDARWDIPHFEKMLYDQAALSRWYVDLYRATGNLDYRYVADDIFSYLLRERCQSGGGFYAAEDADSEGEEGLFYGWTHKEISELLTKEEMREFQQFFVIQDSGNFEHGLNILRISPESIRIPAESVKKSMLKLRLVRNERPRPMTDHKIVTAWNALTISSLAYAGRVLQNKIYLSAAIQNAEFLLRSHFVSEGLARYTIQGIPKGSAGLSDHAFLVDACLELYQANQESRWLKSAIEIQEQQELLFWDDFSGYYDHAPDEFLLKRTKTFSDSVEPSGNTYAAWNLRRLSVLLPEQERHGRRLEALVSGFPATLDSHPLVHPVLLMERIFEDHFDFKRVCVGKDCRVPLFDWVELDANRRS